MQQQIFRVLGFRGVGNDSTSSTPVCLRCKVAVKILQAPSIAMLMLVLLRKIDQNPKWIVPASSSSGLLRIHCATTAWIRSQKLGGCFVNLGENKDPNIRGLFYLYDLVSICTFMPAGMASVAASAIRMA